MWLYAMGEMKKVAACKVKPYELLDRDAESQGDPNRDGTDQGETDDTGEDDTGKDDIGGDNEMVDKKKDSVGAFYMRMDKSECFDESSVYVVELPVSEHKRLEVIEAKETELENLKAYETFEEVDDEGVKAIGS